MAWMPMSAAEVELGVGRTEVFHLLASGGLEGIVVKGRQFVTCDSVAELRRERVEGGGA